MGMTTTSDVPTLVPERFLRDWSSVQRELAHGPNAEFFRKWIPDWLTRPTPPAMDELYGLLDRVWDEDPPRNDAAFSHYYSHPVWELNAKYEQIHMSSISHRFLAVQLARGYSPKNALDKGGGHGLLLRMASDVLPDTHLDLHDIGCSLPVAKDLKRFNIRLLPEPAPP